MTGFGNMGQIGNIPNYQYVQNNFTANQNNFNGDTAVTPLSNSVPAQLASKASGGQENPLGLLASFGIGAAFCMVVEKFIDSLSKRNGNLENSSFDRFIQKVDQNAGVKTIDNFIKNQASNGIIKSVTDSLENSKTFDHFKEGYSRVSLLSPASTEIQLIEKIGEELKKVDASKLTGFSDDIKNVIQKLKNSSNGDKLTPKEFSLIKELKEDQLKKLSPDIKLLTDKVKILQKVENKSFLSKFLVKSGIGTGHFLGGGMIGILLNGFFVGQSIKAAIDAPKGEKFSTLMEDILGNWIGAWVLMFPMAKLVNGIAGFRNIKDPSGLGEKILSKVGKLVGLGLDNKAAKTFDAVMGAKNIFGKNGKIDMFGKWIGGPKGFAGGALRAILVMFVLTPITSEAFKKISHMLFGKPTHPEEENTKENQKHENLEQKQQSSNLVKDFLNKNQLQQPIIRPQAQKLEQSQTEQQKEEQPTQRYIPSPMPGVSVESNALLNDELAKSEKWEKHANSILNQLKG